MVDPRSGDIILLSFGGAPSTCSSSSLLVTAGGGDVGKGFSSSFFPFFLILNVFGTAGGFDTGLFRDSITSLSLLPPPVFICVCSLSFSYVSITTLRHTS